VDTDRHLYFWIKGSHAVPHSEWQFLAGEEFTSRGIQSLDDSQFENLWIIAGEERQPLNTHIELVHLKSSGWTLRAKQDFAFPLPCLLTSDPTVVRVFLGKVKLDSEDVECDIYHAVGDGIPLVGDNWFGIGYCDAKGDVWLRAFSNSAWRQVGARLACCPWWHENIESAEGTRFIVNSLA